MGYGEQIVSRFEDKIIILEDTCWVWAASHSSTGYGSFRISGKTYNAHRLSYELYRGDIPSGLHLDRLCLNRSCVNPHHLEAVTQGENIRRGVRSRGVACGHNSNKRICPECKHDWYMQNRERILAKLKEVNK